MALGLPFEFELAVSHVICENQWPVLPGGLKAVRHFGLRVLPMPIFSEAGDGKENLST